MLHFPSFIRVLSIYPTYQCASDELVVTELHPQCNMDPEFFKPRLLFGETRQGFMTTEYVPAKRSVDTINSSEISAFLLQDALYAL